MTAPIHTEIVFEDEVCEHLKAHGWLCEGPLPHQAGHAYDAGYDARLGLYPADALAWVKGTQPDTWARFAKNHTQDPDGVFLRRLSEELDRNRPTLHPDKPQLWGTLYMLRKGFEDINATFRMAQFAPANQQNPATWGLFQKNRLRVVHQLHYSLHNRNCIDLVLFLNGLPLATIELKTDTTQNIEDAEKQYQFDRLPVDKATRQPEPLLSFGKRALVHFAVSTDEVRMTTRLAGAGTTFLPFNRGTPDGLGGAGAGNAPDTVRGYATGYLWHEVLQRDALLGSVGKFLAVQVSEHKDAKGRKTWVPRLLFPRYHQWHVVNELLDATLAEGVGQSYLVMHSAGSGKSNTIGWLAHRLAALHGAQDQKVFSSVIVITDRRVLDTQLQDTVYQFDHQDGVVEKIDGNSSQLAEARDKGRLIIITTLQKFPYVLSKVGELGNRRFALILDEAHSSHSGTAAVKLREVLTTDGKPPRAEAQLAPDTDYENAAQETAELTGEDLINHAIAQLVAARKRPPNVSYYAFTATPKPKTLELFGRAGADGLPEPFHVYSMRQAIEEEFILDVLKGYTTYASAFRLEQTADDQDVKSGKAKKKLFRYAQLHPTGIGQKMAIIVAHFRTHVMHLLGGQAKAMVVTDSRVAAVRCKKEFDAYTSRHQLADCKALVAFSGKVTDTHSEALYPVDNADEGSLNDQRERDDGISTAFETDGYQLLIVASKFQTGFDQPKLVAMHVVAYDFLSQLVDYDNADLERLHAFAKSLLPRLYGKSDQAELLDGAARLAGYVVDVNSKTDHTLNLNSGTATPMKPIGLPGSPWEDPSDRLCAIIQKMNQIFAGHFTEGDFTAYANTLLAKLDEDATLREQAQGNDTVDAFRNGAFETKLNHAVVEALESHGAMADQALKHAVVFKGLANALVGEANLRLRGEAGRSPSGPHRA